MCFDFHRSRNEREGETEKETDETKAQKNVGYRRVAG